MKGKGVVILRTPRDKAGSPSRHYEYRVAAAEDVNEFEQPAWMGVYQSVKQDNKVPDCWLKHIEKVFATFDRVTVYNNLNSARCHAQIIINSLGIYTYRLKEEHLDMPFDRYEDLFWKLLLWKDQSTTIFNDSAFAYEWQKQKAFNDIMNNLPDLMQNLPPLALGNYYCSCVGGFVISPCPICNQEDYRFG